MDTNEYSVYTDVSSLTLRHWHVCLLHLTPRLKDASLSLRRLRPELVCLHAFLCLRSSDLWSQPRATQSARLRQLTSEELGSSGVCTLCCSGRGGEAQDGQKADVRQRIARLPDNVVTGRDWRRRPISALKPSRGPASPALHIYLPEAKGAELNVIS